MSENPDDQPSGQAQGDQSQAGQTGGQQTGGQPAGGQQDAGQQPGGQRAAGQAPAGQPQQQYYNTGPGIGDIFSIPETMAEIKHGVAMFTIVGIGAGIALLGAGLAVGGGSTGGQIASVISALSAGLTAVPIAICTILAFFIAVRQVDELESQPDDIAMATAGVTAAIGSLIAYFIVAMFAMTGVGAFAFTDILVPLLFTVIGTAVIGAGIIWANRSLLVQNPPAAGHPEQSHQSRQQ